MIHAAHVNIGLSRFSCDLFCFSFCLDNKLNTESNKHDFNKENYVFYAVNAGLYDDG